MKLIKNPWKNIFLELVSSAQSNVKLAAPFVKADIIQESISALNPSVNLSLITSFKLMNFYTGFSDISALDLIVGRNGTVKNFQRLHSKFYIFDDKQAVITSGNLTSGGMVRNHEFGVLVNDKSLVQDIVGEFEVLSSNDSTGTITSVELAEARAILEMAPKSTSITLPEISGKIESEEFELYVGGAHSIEPVLIGWKKEVFHCLSILPDNVVELKDFQSFIPALSQKYPGNRNIEAKIRQQLQLLRDIGLIEFMGNGVYRKLWI